MVKRQEETTKTLLSLLLAVVVLLAGVLLSGCPSSNPEDLTDSDGDGVPDKLEINGYFWKDGKFRQWDGSPDVTYYRTDPTQPSTDQDPYSDGMEVSGIKMDTSVAAPGNHPLVPAYPNIYVSMVGFDVTQKAAITSTTGRKTESSWQNATTDESTKEHHWDVSTSVTAKTTVGPTGVGGEGSVSVTVGAGGKYGSKNSITKSTSGFSDEEWKEATTMNPAEAAKIKLRLRFENRGTAAGQNIIPTVNITLGDKTINTYEMQEDKKIDVLAVNQVFPETGEWIIGDKAAGMGEIILTLDELKVIQLGVPLFLDMPQMDAEVVEENEQGHWEVVDSWQNYKARIDGVCARITVDLGHGKMKDYRVYAKSPNGPQVTLRDALKWTVGCEETAEGVQIMDAPVRDWRIGFSENAIDSVMAQLQGEADNNVLDLVLDAGWIISIKAPSGKDEPEIVWCYGSQKKDTMLITAAVIDDYAVSKVLFKNTPEAAGEEMEAGPTRTGIYRIELTDYSVTGEEIIEAINDRKKSAIKPVDVPKLAPIADGDYVITSVGSNKSLDTDRDEPEVGANVIQYNYYGAPKQQWSLKHIGRGYYRIMTKDEDGKKICLEVVESRRVDNANVQLNKWQNTDNQKWTLEPAGDGCYKIIAKHSGKYLDIDESSKQNKASAIQNTGSDSDSQKWIVQPADSYPETLPTRGTKEEHFIILSKSSDTCLTFKGGGTPSVYSWWGGDNQRWRIVPVGDGYFRICAKHSGKCLTLKDNKVLQQPYSGDDRQKWLLKKHENVQSGPNYYYEIENKESRKCLTLKGSGSSGFFGLFGSSSRFNLMQKEYVGGENQKWQLRPAEQSWLNNIAVTANKKNTKAIKPPEDNAGWVRIEVDLNQGAGGDFIYLWLRGPARDNIAVTVNNKKPPSPTNRWTKIGDDPGNKKRVTDLNRGCGGDTPYIWLWAKGPARDNIAVTANKKKTKAIKPPEDNAGWVRIDVDLNQGAGGDFLYLWVK